MSPKSRGKGIIHRPVNPRYICSFTVKMRADDRPLLEMLAAKTGLGKVYGNAAKPTPGRQNNPAVQWRVQNQPDCLALVAIFEAVPLWSKKAREFEIWAKAVRYWTYEGKWEGWEPMAVLHDELRAIRVYPNSKEGRA